MIKDIRRSPAPVTLVVAVFLMLLSGRTATPGLEGIDVRFVFLWFVLVYFLLWKGASFGLPGRGQWGPVPGLILLLLGLRALSALWAEPGARVEIGAANSLLVIAAVIIVTEIAQYDAERVRRIFLYCLFLAGLVFAFGSALSGSTQGIGRAVAFGGGPNVFVRYMIWGAIAAIALSLLRKRWQYLLALPLVLLFAALSGSRGGISSAVALAVVFTILFIRRIRPAFAVAIFALSSLIGWLIWSNDQVQYLIGRRFNLDVILDTNYGARGDLWATTVDLFLRAPVVGNGMDSYYALAYVQTGLSYPHNLVLELVSDSGLLGLMALIVLLLAIVLICIKQRAMISITQWGMLAAALFTFFASMTSGDSFDTRFTWVFVALALPSQVQRPIEDIRRNPKKERIVDDSRCSNRPV